MALEISVVYLLPTPHGRFLPALPPVHSEGHTHTLAKATRYFVPFPYPDILMQWFFHLYWNLLPAQPILCILPRIVVGFDSNRKFQRLRTLISQSLTTYDLGDLGENTLRKHPHLQREDNAYVTGSSNLNLM